MNIKTSTGISEFVGRIDELIKGLSKKQKDIIYSRFGIINKKRYTLASLGETYGVTRERIRQLENKSLFILKKNIKQDDLLLYKYDKLLKHIENIGGVVRSDLFIEHGAKIILDDKNISNGYIYLLFKIFNSPKFLRESSDFYPLLYIDKLNLDTAKKFVVKLYSILNKNRKKVVEDNKFNEIFRKVASEFKLSDNVALNFIGISKKFSVSIFGDLGLSEWAEISPKTMKDKAYLILKKNQKPMHFKDIAKNINNANFDRKKAHPQTVHNELIKDDRFVLVGRGLYLLREFGIEPGTTRNVIERILKEKGPLRKDKIMELVSQQRVVEKNTISINLHNKRYFKRLEDGKYHIA